MRHMSETQIPNPNPSQIPIHVRRLNRVVESLAKELDRYGELIDKITENEKHEIVVDEEETCGIICGNWDDFIYTVMDIAENGCDKEKIDFAEDRWGIIRWSLLKAVEKNILQPNIEKYVKKVDKAIEKTRKICRER